MATTTKRRKKTTKKAAAKPAAVVKTVEVEDVQESKTSKVILHYTGEVRKIGNTEKVFNNIITVPISIPKVARAQKEGIDLSNIKNSIIVILPGNNFIDAGLYKLIREDLALLINSGKITEVNIETLEMEKTSYTKGAPKKQEIVSDMEVLDLSDMSIRQAQAVIRDTYNLQTLKEIESGEIETRDSVLKVVRSQIRKINHKKKTGHDLDDEE